MLSLYHYGDYKIVRACSSLLVQYPVSNKQPPPDIEFRRLQAGLSAGGILPPCHSRIHQMPDSIAVGDLERARIIEPESTSRL